ncbi:CapA family protein [Paenibacillus thiaminolyticus]|nr:CapA family protein [Paenibacillus thiaminolyticus]WII35481.1 CapA family protein [Paenibacillus thiaminolyticus]
MMNKYRFKFGKRFIYAMLVILLLTACGSLATNPHAHQGQAAALEAGDEKQSAEDIFEEAVPASADETGQTSETDTASDAEEPAAEAEPYTLSGRLLAVGDIMMHSPQFPAYLNPKTGQYDFRGFFTNVKPILKEADWCWANLETPLLGGEKVYTGYPMFNAPPELADALKDAGFNIVTAANNHTLDRRERGALRTREVLKDRGLVTKGISASLWESKQPTLMDKNGITMGILAYTYGTNGIPLPKDKPYLVSLIDEKRMIEDIQKTRSAGADVVVIALHFGTEYEPNPNKEQIRLARKLVQAGADIILGSHPHVLQPYERLTVKDKHGQTREGLIIYSLGNFISNQRGDGKDVGVIFGVTIEKHMPEGTIELKEISAEPTWVHINGPHEKRKYSVIPLSSVLKDKTDTQFTKQQRQQMSNMKQRAARHVSSMSEVPVLLQALPAR